MNRTGVRSAHKNDFRHVQIAAVVYALPVVLVPELCLAASAAHGEGHVPSIWDLKFAIINFAIYAVAVAFLVKRLAPPAWRARRERILSSIERSRSRIDRAEARLAEAGAKLAQVEREITTLVANIKEEGVREAQDVVVSAQQAAQRITAQAKASAAAEERAAERAVRKQLIERALQRAEAKLRESITSESDRALRDRSQRGMADLVQ